MRLNINAILILIAHRPTRICLHDEDKSCPFKCERQKQHFQTSISVITQIFGKAAQTEIQFICSKVHTSPCFSSMTFVDFTHPFIVSHLDASNVSSFSLWLKIY